jgi:alcohol dehydrogenase class IV
VAAANVRALRERAPNSPALERYEEAARLLTGDPAATADDLVTWLAALVDALGIPPLVTFGVTPEAVPEVCAQARKASSMAGNPVVLTDVELAEVLGAA